jgi:6-phosphogluconolactonase
MIVREVLASSRNLAPLIGGVIALFLITLAFQANGAAQREGEYFVYVGTRSPEGQGIYAYRFNGDTGKIAPLGLAAETPDPFSMVANHDGNHLYAANITRDFQGKDSGSVSAFALNRQTSKLTPLNRVSSRGASPCYVSLDKTERFLLLANYTGGSVAVLPVHEDGSLGEASSFVQHTDSGVDPKKQRPAHPHSINVSADNRFALVADAGLDKLFIYNFNSTTGGLSPATPAYAAEKPDSGPRHFVFSPDGRFVYVVDETASTITAFSYDAASAAMEKLSVVSALPGGFTEKNKCAEIALSRSGRFLYSSNRGNDSIAVFAVNSSNGAVTHVEHVPTQGKTPGMFAIDPSGAYMFVANEDSSNVFVFRVDQETGRLTPSGQVLNVPHPLCVNFIRVH